MRHAVIYDVTFAGHGGDPIRGWLLHPHRATAGAAFIVEYVGYGGGRGDPFDWLKWSCAGHPHLIMDCRGQGGGWRRADTPDLGDNGAPSSSGFLTRGILEPESHYYTRLFIDAARAVDAARDWSHAGPKDIAVYPFSGHEGGGTQHFLAQLAFLRQAGASEETTD